MAQSILNPSCNWNHKSGLTNASFSRRCFTLLQRPPVDTRAAPLG